MYEHLRWHNRKPNPFISLFRDPDSASRSVHLRAQNIDVFNRRTRTSDTRVIASIRVAEISSRMLDDCGVFYFSTKKAKQRLDLKPEQSIWTHLSDKEWFVIGHIPEEAITQEYNLCVNCISELLATQQGQVRKLDSFDGMLHPEA